MLMELKPLTHREGRVLKLTRCLGWSLAGMALLNAEPLWLFPKKDAQATWGRLVLAMVVAALGLCDLQLASLFATWFMSQRRRNSERKAPLATGSRDDIAGENPDA